MDKRKLANIIIKDLEEIKNLAEEVADSQEDSSLVIDLALNRARLLCQEIELLRDLAGNSVSLQEDEDQDSFEILEDEDDVSDISFPDPELEILNFEEREIPETEELPEEEVIEEEELEEDDLEEVEPEMEDDEDLEEEDAEGEQEDDEQENSVEELDEVNLDETEEEDIEEEEQEEETELEEEEEQEEEEEEPIQKTNIQVTELSYVPQSEIREIHIDEFDDDDLEPVTLSQMPGSSGRPQMHEIPKPESTETEKQVVGERYQKERSFNDSIGENKIESKLTNGPITSLRAAIGLNDRFIFIREIFENNSEKYNTVIDRLDKMEHIQEAVEYLKANLAMQKNDASMKFVELLKRRFTS